MRVNESRKLDQTRYLTVAKAYFCQLSTCQLALGHNFLVSAFN